MVTEHYSSPVPRSSTGNRQVETRTATKTPNGVTSVMAKNQTPPILTEVVHFDSSESMEFFDFTDEVHDSVHGPASTMVR